MKIVLQCQKCFAISIDDWVEVRKDGTLYFGRLKRDGLVPPRCHNCKSQELCIGIAQLSGMRIP